MPVTKTAKTRFDESSEAPTLEQCQQQIREYAYELWENAGCPEGDGSDFWVEAEKQLFGELTPQGGYRIYIGSENSTPQPFILTSNGLEKLEKLDQTISFPTTTKKKTKETKVAKA